jgi:hypothetical protein
LQNLFKIKNYDVESFLIILKICLFFEEAKNEELDVGINIVSID